ncbi:Ribosomal RNA small subunit methyltransferase E [Buchnera aphidicola (Protaphis terricola)]|uniref:16S rRNA (uracil(1498)-N(3))-methyltransferase n=1 Tax=Buchnera aphidicola TaxID=9 RepID=UPI0034644320
MKNRIPRIYIDNNLMINEKIILDISNTHYIIKVLRMNIQDKLEIFNNTNYIFLSKIIHIQKKIVTILILNKEKKNIESPLFIHLGLVISKHEKMNFSIQKCVELGVNVITPLFSKYCNINKNKKHILKKVNYWKNIIISACQQCRRNIVPIINYPMEMNIWCQKKYENESKIVLNQKSKISISQLTYNNYIRLLIGCEGGFSLSEIQNMNKYKFISIKLGPRILRTETAAISAVTALQVKFGDLK